MVEKAVSDFEAYLARFSDWQLVHNYSPKTVETRERALRAFFTWAEMRSLTHPKDVTRPILQRYQRLTPIRAFFKWLARENHILYNPAGELDMPRPEQRLPDIETAAGLRDRAIMELLYATAMRRAEAAGLKLWDIDYGRRAITIREGKGGKDRIVPLRTRG